MWLLEIIKSNNKRKINTKYKQLHQDKEFSDEMLVNLTYDEVEALQNKKFKIALDTVTEKNSIYNETENNQERNVSGLLFDLSKIFSEKYSLNLRLLPQQHLSKYIKQVKKSDQDDYDDYKNKIMLMTFDFVIEDVVISKGKNRTFFIDYKPVIFIECDGRHHFVDERNLSKKELQDKEFLTKIRKTKLNDNYKNGCCKVVSWKLLRLKNKKIKKVIKFLNENNINLLCWEDWENLLSNKNLDYDTKESLNKIHTYFKNNINFYLDKINKKEKEPFSAPNF